MRKGLAEALNRYWAWLLLLFLVAPALIALPVSLTPKGFLSMPKGEYSLRHFDKLFTSEEWRSSFWQSAVIALATSALATALGTACAIGLWRVASRLGEAVRAFLLLPLVVPPIISAMAFCIVTVTSRMASAIWSSLDSSWRPLTCSVRTVPGRPW